MMVKSTKYRNREIARRSWLRRQRYIITGLHLMTNHFDRDISRLEAQGLLTTAEDLMGMKAEVESIRDQIDTEEYDFPPTCKTCNDSQVVGDPLGSDNGKWDVIDCPHC